MAVFSILIVGDGVVGLSAAWRLARAGHRVTVIGDGGTRSTDAAAGMLASSFEGFHERTARPLAPILDEALTRWPDFAAELIAETGAEIGYSQDGIYAVGFPYRPSPKAVETAPPAAFPVSRAWFVPDEGQADPRLLRTALLKAIAGAGGQYVAGHASGLDLSPDGITLRVGEEKLACDRLVLAGGVRSGELLPGGFEMEGVRGRAFLQYAPSLDFTHVVRTPNVYFCPKGEGRLYVGATEEVEAGEPAMLDGLWWEAVAICPGLQGTERLMTFDGVRPALKGGLPQIGHWAEDERVYLALGHDRNGILLSPLTAERVVLAHGL